MLQFDDALMKVAEALDSAGLPWAFGGAIAFVFHAQPRATTDIDVNIFVPETGSQPVLAALEAIGVPITEAARRMIERDGQVRLWWDPLYVDLFFNTVPFLDAAAGRTVRVPYSGREIPILAAEDIALCKLAFDRPKDWIDLEQLIKMEAQRLDRAYLRHWMVEMFGDDSRVERLERLLDTNPL